MISINSEQWEELFKQGMLSNKGIETYNNRIRADISFMESDLDIIKKKNTQLEQLINKRGD